MPDANVTKNRKKYIGGSDLPNILGLNEIKFGDSLFDFAKKKMKLIPNDFKGNEYTKYGQLMEPIIREYLNATNGTNYVEDTVIDEDLLQRGNTDGIDRHTEDFPPMIEVKTFGEKSGLDIEYYTSQCRFYMERFDQDAIAIVGYPRPDDFYTGVDYSIENDDHFFNLDFDPEKLVIEVIHRDETEWQKIQSRIEQFQKACIELEKNPDMTLDEWNTIFYGADLVKQQNQLIKLENKMLAFKEIEKAHKKAKADLLEKFDEYGVKTIDTGKIRITRVLTDESRKTVLDEAKLKKEQPKIHAKYNTKEKVTKGKDYLLVTVKKLGGDEA